MKKLILKVLLFALPVLLLAQLPGRLLVAQDNTTQVALTDAQRAKYWRAQYERVLTECAADKARAKWLETIVELSKACNADVATVTLDGSGEPVCAVVPPPVPEPAK